MAHHIVNRFIMSTESLNEPGWQTIWTEKGFLWDAIGIKVFVFEGTAGLGRQRLIK